MQIRSLTIEEIASFVKNKYALNSFYMRSSTMDDESNNGFGPISQKRKQRGQLFAASLMLVFLILAYKISGSGYDEVIQLLLCTAVAIFGEVIKGMCLFVEEFFHIRQR